MKKFIVILLFLAGNHLFSQFNKEKDFKKTLKEVINFYNNKDFEQLNGLINKKTGIYFIIKNGTYDYWQNIKTLTIKNSKSDVGLNFPYNEIINQQIIYNDFNKIFLKQYSYKCNSQNSEGIYVSSKDKTFSTLILKYSKYNDLGLKKSDLKKQLKIIKAIEFNSRKIVLINNDSTKWGKNFIFYLTYIKNKWHLTIVDFATLDCSA